MTDINYLRTIVTLIIPAVLLSVITFQCWHKPNNKMVIFVLGLCIGALCGAGLVFTMDRLIFG